MPNSPSCVEGGEKQFARQSFFVPFQLIESVFF